MTTPDDARIKLGIELHRSILENDGMTPLEADSGLNAASRSLVAAVAAEHGQAWLWRFNPVGEVVARPWHDEIVCNFDADAVTSTCDRELLRLILERVEAPYTGTHEDGRRLDKILDHLDAIGGMLLVWS
jgi:hypothetical protein